MSTPGALTRDELAVLRAAAVLEILPNDGSRHNYVRERLQLPYTTYLHRLNRLLDSPEALAGAPELVYRLRRVRVLADARRGRACG